MLQHVVDVVEGRHNLDALAHCAQAAVLALLAGRSGAPLRPSQRSLRTSPPMATTRSTR